MKHRIGILVGMGLVLGSVGAMAGGEKIAVVNSASLIQSHPDTQKANDLLSKQRDEFEAEKKDLMEKFDSMRSAFNETREAAFDKALSEAGQEKKQKEAEAQLRELEQFKRQIQDTFLQRQDELSALQKRMGSRIVKKVRAVIDAYSKKKGIVLVFDSANRGLSGVEGILYYSDVLDITDDILKEMEKPSAEEETTTS